MRFDTFDAEQATVDSPDRNRESGRLYRGRLYVTSMVVNAALVGSGHVGICDGSPLNQAMYAVVATGEGTEHITVPVVTGDSKRKVLAKVTSGRQFRILKEGNHYVQVRISVGGKWTHGWIDKRKVDRFSWIRIAPEKATVRLNIDEETLTDDQAHVLKGEVYFARLVGSTTAEINVPVTDQQSVTGRFAKASIDLHHVDFLDHRSPPLSTTGLTAGSISPAEVDVEWRNRPEATQRETKIVTVVASPPLRGSPSSVEIHEPNGATDHKSPRIEVRGSKVFVVDDSETLRNVVVDGTRSLWIKETHVFRQRQVESELVRFHRIDLPAVHLSHEGKISDYRRSRPRAFDEGLVLRLPVDGLMPGFVLERADFLPSGELSSFEPAPTKPGEQLPRLADADRSNLGSHTLRIVVPFPENVRRRSDHVVRVLNFDGSYSESVRISCARNGITFRNFSEVPAIPGQLDTAVQVPNVELVDAFVAEHDIRRAGLVAKFVDRHTFQPVDVPSPNTHLVTRQGIAPLARVPTNTTIVLGVSNTSEHFSSFRDPVADRLSSARSNRINVGDQFDVLLIPRLTTVSSRTEVARLTLATQPLVEENGSLGILSVPVEGGFNVSQDSASRGGAHAVELKTAVQALLAQPTWQNLPGALGNTFSDVIQLTLDKQLSAESTVNELSAAALDIVSRIRSTLGVQLTQEQESRALSEFRAFCRDKSPLLDRNDNGVIGDDLLVWLLSWMLKNDVYEPSQHVRVIRHSGSDAFVYFLNKNGPRPSFDELDINFLTDSLTVVPQGKPLVSNSDPPDRLRVPDRLIGKSFIACKRELLRWGLHVTNGQSYLDDDTVVQVSPQSGTWVSPRTAIRLTANRTLPSVAEMHHAQAVRTLRTHGFEDIVWTIAPQKRDTVFSQQPSGGAKVRTNQRITLDPAVTVPNVEGLELEAAKRALSEISVRASLTARYSTFTTNRKLNKESYIISNSQSPKKGKYRRANVSEVRANWFQWLFALPDLRRTPVDTAIRELERLDLAVDFIIFSEGEVPRQRKLTPQQFNALIKQGYAANKRYYRRLQVERTDPGSGDPVDDNTVTIFARWPFVP